jgi:hypothetical protein
LLSAHESFLRERAPQVRYPGRGFCIRSSVTGEALPAAHIRTRLGALVEAVRAIAIGISPAARRAINWNADGLEKDAIGGASGHGRNQRYTPKVLGNELLGRADDLWIQQDCSRWDVICLRRFPGKLGRMLRPTLVIQWLTAHEMRRLLLSQP